MSVDQGAPRTIALRHEIFIAVTVLQMPARQPVSGAAGTAALPMDDASGNLAFIGANRDCP